MPHANLCRGLIAIALVALLPGCHGHADAEAKAAANAQGYVPPAPLPATPMPGQAPLTPLTAYLGHDPHEPVDGVEFFDRTDVSTALIAAVKDERARNEFREGSGERRPIFARGTRIGAWACDGQDCAGHNWTFFVDRNTHKGVACLHEAKTMGATSRWYAGSARPAVRDGECPSA